MSVRTVLALECGLLVTAVTCAGCYHFAFDLGPPENGASLETVSYVTRPPTFINGFFGTGNVDAKVFCAHPLRTELFVSATDVLVSVATLLIYTPHTLTVVCPVGDRNGVRPTSINAGGSGRE
jgi:hypothetical protein